MARPLVLLVLIAAGAFAVRDLQAQKTSFVPKPNTYICPNAEGAGAVNCYLDAVEHLYTMCRQVKSIEIIEFGYEQSDQGVNGAKSEYCVDKHKVSMTRPYQAALREATGSRGAVDHLRALQAHWLQSLQGLKWKPGETDDEYKVRIGRPYESFRERAAAVRVALKSRFKAATAATGGGDRASSAKPAASQPAKGPAR